MFPTVIDLNDAPATPRDASAWSVRAAPLSLIGEAGCRAMRDAPGIPNASSARPAKRPAAKGRARTRAESDAESGWLPAAVPGDVHLDLMRAGLMDEPLFGDNAHRSRWPETKSWWYVRAFDAPAALLAHERQRIVFDGLDHYAQVFVNGALAGEAANSFIPHEFDVKRLLRPGRNELAVRVTAGQERVPHHGPGRAPAPERVPNPAVPGDLYGHRDPRDFRVWLRKPQFSYGWDWVEALPNIGLWRGVRLEGHSGVSLAELRLDADFRIEAGSPPDPREAFLDGEMVLDNLHPWSERRVTVMVLATGPDGRTAALVEHPVHLPSGRQTIPLRLRIDKPRYWWPRPLGGQPLYTVRVTVRGADGTTLDQRELTVGLRRIEIDRDELADGSRFTIAVNGRRVYAQGANWIPADAILARVSREKYETLVREAAAAGCNMLRVWGGGIYEDPAFYDACDRLGILVWQDFMYACALYPDDDPAFADAARVEADAVVRALRHHPCIALWCGNNENHAGMREWWNGDAASRFEERNNRAVPDALRLGGARLYHQILPESCRLHDPHRAYWPSSPYGGASPNDENAGDCHWWGPATMHADADRRIRHEVYDECRARFVSEYGVIGPLSMASYRACLPPADVRPDAPAFQLHTNTFDKRTTPAAIALHYADPDGLPVEDYIRYGQLFQAMLYEKSLEALRFRAHDPRDPCSGGLIWMYSDCWGETGWTVIDYFLRRKPSWYALRRAFLPVKPIVRQRGGRFVTRLFNSRPDAREGALEYGWFPVDGGPRQTRKVAVSVPGDGMLEMPADPVDDKKAPRDPRAWLYAALWRPKARARKAGAPSHDAIADGEASCVYPLLPARELVPARADLDATPGPGGRITLRSPVYLHGVGVDDDGRGVLSDNYFDLLPGVPHTVVRLDGRDTPLSFKVYGRPGGARP